MRLCLTDGSEDSSFTLYFPTFGAQFFLCLWSRSTSLGVFRGYRYPEAFISFMKTRKMIPTPFLSGFVPMRQIPLKNSTCFNRSLNTLHDSLSIL